MKKRNVINLIKYYSEGNDRAFRDEAYTIANDFDKAGDLQLAEYVMALLSDANAFVPQSLDDEPFCTKVNTTRRPLALPKEISNDLEGVMNAINRNFGVNKFLFYGAPGTGKTESAKYIAYLMNRELLSVNFDCIIDSKLGQTSKNITKLFNEIRGYKHPEKLIFLFDEIDALALDRIDSHDVREMGRATSSFLKELDNLADDVVIIATTNLFKQLDRALTRRFDICISFDRYTKENLREIAKTIMEHFLSQYEFLGRDIRLFDKMLDKAELSFSPAELYNIMKTCIAFSDPKNEYDYLSRIYESLLGKKPGTYEELSEEGFTVREIAHLIGTSKSTVARELKGRSNE